MISHSGSLFIKHAKLTYEKDRYPGLCGLYMGIVSDTKTEHKILTTLTFVFKGGEKLWKMKRTIKFRAWNGSKMLLPEHADWETLFILPDGDLCRMEENGKYEVHMALCYLTNIELMQYTGLKDKNGKEIYEGDIVKCYDNAAIDAHEVGKIHIGIIEYIPPVFVLKIPGDLTYDGVAVRQWANDVYLDQWDNAENIEIIDNIYEHPELIKSHTPPP